MSSVLVLHVIATAFMTGVIWFVQLVHYPSFRWIDRAKFPDFAIHHQFYTTVVVAPAMLCELVTGFALLTFSYFARPAFLYGNVIALSAIWGCTYFLSVPLHRRLEKGYDDRVVDKLVNTNWPRTLLWSARSLLFLFLLGAKI